MSTKTHITGIRTVSIPVDDQEAALAFYVDTLGFALLRDMPTPGGGRWIELAPGDASTIVTLEPALPAVTRGAIGIRFTTDAASAELVKIGANAFLALKVGYANEMARLAAAAGADVTKVLATIGLDRRIGRDFLAPGPGFGGSCLPSQARALPRVATEMGVDVPIIAAIEGSNRAQAEWVVEQLERRIGDMAGMPIPGLYAAGSTIGGLDGGPHSGYVGGLIKTALGLHAAEVIAGFKA